MVDIDDETAASEHIDHGGEDSIHLDHDVYYHGSDSFYAQVQG